MVYRYDFIADQDDYTVCGCRMEERSDGTYVSTSSYVELADSYVKLREAFATFMLNEIDGEYGINLYNEEDVKLALAEFDLEV
jgi:hypothetical protein